MSFLGNIAGALVGGAIGQDSSRRASNQQADAARAADETQRYMYDQTRADNAPLLASRNSALSQIQALLANPSGITKQPGYQFGLQQGTNALQNSATAQGMTYSGAQAKALQRYGQDYAGTKLDQTYNRLSNLAGMGQVGANNNATAGANYANSVSGNQIGMGNARAGNSLYQGNTWANALNQGIAAGNTANWGKTGTTQPGWREFGGTVNDPWYG